MDPEEMFKLGQMASINGKLIAFYRSPFFKRKLTLFCCGCVRSIKWLFPEDLKPLVDPVVGNIEKIADGRPVDMDILYDLYRKIHSYQNIFSPNGDNCRDALLCLFYGDREVMTKGVVRLAIRMVSPLDSVVDYFFYNYFQREEIPTFVSPLAKSMAESLYETGDKLISNALADMQEEDGCYKAAYYLRNFVFMKGNWVVDRLIGDRNVYGRESS